MKKLITVLALAAWVLSAVPRLALADGCPMGKCNMMAEHDKMCSKMDMDDMLFLKIHFILSNASEIGITDEQTAKIKDIRYSTKKSIIKYDADIETLALDIKEALMKDDIDTVIINGLIDKKYSAKAAKAKEAVNAYAGLLKVITKEQRKKIKDMWMAGMTGSVKCEMMEKKGSATNR